MKKKSIMLVEDNPHDEVLTTRLLAQHGVFTEVMVVRDGQEALDNLLRDGDQASDAKVALPALILLDLNLPKVHGLEVLRCLRANPLTKMLRRADGIAVRFRRDTQPVVGRLPHQVRRDARGDRALCQRDT